MKKLLLIALSCGLFILFLLLKKDDSSSKKTYTIAIITKETPYHYKVNEGFMAALKEDRLHTYDVRLFITKEQDFSLTASLAKEATSSSPDVILTVGALASQATHSVITKRNVDIPQIFAGAGNPIKLGLSSSIERPDKNATGVNMGPMAHEHAAQALYDIKQNMSHILLPYSPHIGGGSVEEGALRVAKFFDRKGIKVTMLPLEKISEVMDKIRLHSNGIDTIMMLEDCLVNDVAPGLIKFCSEKGITLFASEEDFVAKGAAAGYGADTRETGKAAFEYVQKVVLLKTPISKLPIKHLDNTGTPSRKAFINKAALKKQNLTLKPGLSKNMKEFSTITPWKT